MTPASAERRSLDDQLARGERQRASQMALADGRQQLVAALSDAADYDERRIEQVHHAREHQPYATPRRLQQGDGHRIAERRSPRDRRR